MPYETTCPKGHRLQVSDSHLGQRIQCPACNESFVVPDGRTMPAAPPSRGRLMPFDMGRDLLRLARWTGRPLVAVGLLLVLLSRGCDTINQHWAVRASIVAETAAQQFDEDIQSRKLVLQNEMNSISGHGDLKAEDRKKLDELRKELAEWESQAARDRAGKEAGEWHDLRTAARSARQSFALNSYWHELFFVFSASVLVLGLLIVSWGAEGAERWMSLVMLAIVVYSLFVGGAAWTPVSG